MEKQVKNLINRTLSGFKTLIWISLALTAVGLVCMFGISYGFYRPVIGFAVMLLFEVCAFVIDVLAVNRTRDMKTDNELFNDAEERLIAKFNRTLGSLSFIAFFASFAAVLLSLPLVLITDGYSVLSGWSYFSVFFIVISLLLMLIFLKCQKPYRAWITGEAQTVKEESPANPKIRKMNVLQIGLTVLGALLFVLAPYGQTDPTDVFSLYDVIAYIGLACLAASIVCFVVFLIKSRGLRKELVIPGIRNICLIPSAMIVAGLHSVGWQHTGPEDELNYSISYLERSDSWQTEYVWQALALAVLVFVIFSFIDVLIKRRTK